MIKGNKGDWAEFYAFLKILSDQKLPSADAQLKVKAGRFFEFIRLNWNDPKNGLTFYNINPEQIEILNSDNEIQKTIPTSFVSSKLNSIFSEILLGKGRSFNSPTGETMMEDLFRTSIKAPNSEKADIFGTLLDRNTNTPELAGFSVKSILQNQASLLNASGTTLFRYELLGLSHLNPDKLSQEIAAINKKTSPSHYLDRVEKIHDLGGNFLFSSMNSDVFESTLRKIDTMMPEFVAEMLVGFFSRKGKTLPELVAHLANSNITKDRFNFSLSAEDYKFKLQQLLNASALGMQPSKPWDGMMRASGGYIIVVKSGDVLCYHAFNRDVFLNYLFDNTVFESPAGRKAKHLEIIQDNGRLYTDLKLQIRFG